MMLSNLSFKVRTKQNPWALDLSGFVLLLWDGMLASGWNCSCQSCLASAPTVLSNRQTPPCLTPVWLLEQEQHLHCSRPIPELGNSSLGTTSSGANETGCFNPRTIYKQLPAEGRAGCQCTASGKCLACSSLTFQHSGDRLCSLKFKQILKFVSLKINLSPWHLSLKVTSKYFHNSVKTLI